MITRKCFESGAGVIGVMLVLMLSCGAQQIGFTSGDSVQLLRNGEPLLDFRPLHWGPNWSFVGLKASSRSENGGTVIQAIGKSGEATVQYDVCATPKGGGKLDLAFTLSADRDTVTTLGVIAMTPGRLVRKTAVTQADGSRHEIEGGYGRNGLGKAVTGLTLTGESGVLAELHFDPAIEILSDGAARLVLASGRFPGNAPRKVTVSVQLRGELTYYSSTAEVPFEAGFDTWYAWQPTYAYDRPSALAMEDWLDKPAGRLGRIRRDGDSLKTGDRPIRLWGLNLCYSACAPDKELAEKQARFYARHGVNSVRLHKYADGTGWAGIQSQDSFVDLDPAGLDRMDYLIATFKKHGIYTKLSAHFGTPKLGVGDKARVPYLEEFGRLDAKPGARVAIPASGVYYSPELQDVQIAHYVNLLRHRNPHTGLTYAEDPAIAFIEILNEQSILFYTSMGPLKASATLRDQVGRRFCDWLRKKYGSHEGLLAAWGARALNSFGAEGFAASGEGLDANNILPLGNPWFWDPEQLDGSQAFRRQRLLDSMVFLVGLQDAFNARFVEAVRKAGYAGEIVASNWQAGRAYSHFMNLHSDALVGTVDRHNYFGGMGNTMLDKPGSGLLSSGLQQVAGRPFMLSEWIHTSPNEFGVEGPALIGAYGMGLQGWDVSYMFQNRDTGEFSTKIGRDQWDVTAPQILGVFPAVARQVLSGDVRTADVVNARNVHVPSLAAGKLGFEERVQQQGDVKEFAGVATPPEALALARCVVAFTDAYRETPAFDTAPYLKDGVLRASTGQLVWTTGTTRQQGHFTIDSKGTQALVGFAQGKTAMLSVATLTCETPFAAIYVTAAKPGTMIATADTLLVTAIARARNSGAKIVGDTVLDNGQPPIVMEPVRAKIVLARSGTPTVWVLDHDGVRTGDQVPVSNGAFMIDGAKYKTPYYEVEYAH